MTKPLTSADFDGDYAKERAFIELGAEQMLRPAPHRPLYFPENPDTKNEVLNQIIKENVEASQINYHE